MRELHADRRGQAKTHGAQATGVDPAPWFIELVELRGPHLMLAHVGSDECIAACQLIELLQHILRLDDRRLVVVFEAVHRAPFLDLLPVSYTHLTLPTI